MVQTMTTPPLHVSICLKVSSSILAMMCSVLAFQPMTPILTNHDKTSSAITTFKFQSMGTKSWSSGYNDYHNQAESSFFVRTAIHSAGIDDKEGSADEPDLFEYFDPLLSPHAYPDGVSPKTKPILEKTIQGIRPEQQQKQRPRMTFFGVGDYYPAENVDSVGNVAADSTTTTPTTSTTTTGLSASESTGSGKNLFEYFDPLLSPHAYPNGISPTAKPKEMESTTSKNEYATTSSLLSSPTPTLTPTSSSTSSTQEGKRGNKIGILLMDHGSRNAASNARLQALADLYQLTLDASSSSESSSSSSSSSEDGQQPPPPPQYVVKAAHMEITTPTIPEGLQSLLDAGVDEIVCHPYFLSPGRHVKEDIPKIVNDAIASMKITIPVITTAPVGSNTQLMLGAIHSLVRENSQLLKQQQIQ